MEAVKKFWQSKANWLALAQFIGAVIPLYLGTSTSVLGADMALKLAGTFLGISAILQAAIRTFWTDSPVSLR